MFDPRAGDDDFEISPLLLFLVMPLSIFCSSGGLELINSLNPALGLASPRVTRINVFNRFAFLIRVFLIVD